MLDKRIKQSVSLIMLVTLLFVVSFTSQAAPVIPVDDMGQAMAETVPTINPAEEVVKLANQTSEEGKQKVLEEQAYQKVLQEDIKLLASIIFCEAGNQSYEGQVAVGAVVMNRINSSRFPNTLQEVIYQKGQFTPAGSGWLDEVHGAESYTESSVKAAEAALKGENPIGECLFFDQGGKGMKLGAHYFH